MRPLVLASGSSARAAVLAEAGVEFIVDRPEVDEREHDSVLADAGPTGLAARLANLKADAVAPRHPAALVLAADQVAVLLDGSEQPMLTKQPEREGAVEQLMRMSGSTHQLHNVLVLVDTETGERCEGYDVQTITMCNFDRAAAEAYVDRFEPYESAGSYRIEDQDLMAPEDRLVDRFVAGPGMWDDGEIVANSTGEGGGVSDLSGVRGLPLETLAFLFAWAEGREG